MLEVVVNESLLLTLQRKNRPLKSQKAYYRINLIAPFTVLTSNEKLTPAKFSAAAAPDDLRQFHAEPRDFPAASADPLAHLAAYTIVNHTLFAFYYYFVRHKDRNGDKRKSADADSVCTGGIYIG